MLSLGKMVASKTGQKIMTRMYGIGAALVIIGALFKLQHWNHAGIMLSVGMITECIIFFFSAFEPLPVSYHWENVYPELKADNLNLEENGALPANGSRARIQPVQSGGADLAIDAESADQLKKGVERFNQSLNSLNSLATIGNAAQLFVSGLQQAAGNINTLNDATQTFTNAYRETAQTITAGGQQTNTSIGVLNKNMQAVNTSYELFLQEHREYVEHSKKLLGTMDNSAKQAQQFDQQMIELNKMIAELNTAYTSMVHTVNTTLKKK